MTRLQSSLLFNSKYIQVAKGGKMAKALASRQGGLNAAPSVPPPSNAAAKAAKDAAAAKAAAAVLENAADVVEREDATSTLLRPVAVMGGVGAVIGAARQSGLTRAYENVGSPAGKAGGGSKLTSWLRNLGDDVERGAGGVASALSPRMPGARRMGRQGSGGGAPAGSRPAPLADPGMGHLWGPPSPVNPNEGLQQVDPGVGRRAPPSKVWDQVGHPARRQGPTGQP